MKVWKLVSGIMSMVFFFIMIFQSCAAGVVDAIDASGGTGGAAGIICAFLMLAGGIVSVAARTSTKGGNIAIIVIYVLAAIIGFTMHGVYTDLIIFSVWCLICAILAIVSLVLKK